MGRSALRLLAFATAISWANVAFAQAPAPASGGVPAGQPLPAAPPPLYPPAPTEPASPPAFFRSTEPPPAPRAKKANGSAAERAPGFAEVTLTSYSIENRYGNFLNIGAQVGGYLFGRIRLAGRIIAPLAEVTDDWQAGNSIGASGSYTRLPSRQVSLLYGGSAGIVLASTNTFVLAPGVAFARADVSDYGTTVMMLMPFEWITTSNMRINFEIGVGRGLGGQQTQICRSVSGSTVVSCGTPELDRPNGFAFFISFGMGYGF